MAKDLCKKANVSQVLFSSEKCEWATPPDFFAALNAEFGFTLDVCALPENAKCDQYFTPEQDGLKQPWTGCCWMNPPYGRTIGRWMDKAWEESQRGATIVCLVPARTDTQWWHRCATRGEVRFVPGRLKFGNSKNSAPFPSAIVIFRPPVVDAATAPNGPAALVRNAAVAAVDAVAVMMRTAVVAAVDAAVQVSAGAQLDAEIAADQAQADLTVGQRRFIAERSVTLLVKLTKGEITPEAALRQAEGMPVRKGKIKPAGPGQDGAGLA